MEYDFSLSCIARRWSADTIRWWSDDGRMVVGAGAALLIGRNVDCNDWLWLEICGRVDSWLRQLFDVTNVSTICCR